MSNPTSKSSTSGELRENLIAERRKRHLKSLVEEAVINILAEQQPPVAPPATPPPPPAPPPAPEAPPAAPESPEGDGQHKEFTVDDMIERLNVIRGGRSFTDPEVYGQMVTYFKGLNDEQKANLQGFLVELGKIVINVNEQEQAGGVKQQPGQQVSAPPQGPPPGAAGSAPVGGAPGGGMAPPPTV